VKILIVRFSSIGDIVLTSPVIRCLKKQLPDVEIHYLTKSKFKELLEFNPHIHLIWTIEKNLKEIIQLLQKEKFDYIIDLHHNLRTAQLKRAIKSKSYSFSKLNFQKWWLVNFKKNKMPDVHIVDRYMETLEPLGIKNDGGGLELFLPTVEENNIEKFNLPENFVAFAIGAQFATKVMPLDKIVMLLQQTQMPIVFLGGPDDVEKANTVKEKLADSEIFDLTGKLTLMESARIVKEAKVLITHDTGLMHIAAAFQVSIVSIWGNTVPELGMYPYLPKHQFSIHEVKGLSCRPCSKIGFKKCPKGHFNCMNQQDFKTISKDIVSRYETAISKKN
jgi:ADP-heptose:LPS heptosyltransferase